MTNCLFCQIAKHQASVDGQPENVILYESDNFYVKPALGHFVEGYCLVITKEHARTMAELDAEECIELNGVIDELTDRLKALYPNSSPNSRCIFEHGAACPSNRAGACIDHAHLHVLPVHCDLRSRLSGLSGTPVNGVRALTHLHSEIESYIYYQPEANLGMVYSCHDRIPSQFMRRLVCKQLFLNNDWDWRLSPHRDKIQDFLANWFVSFPRQDVPIDTALEAMTMLRVPGYVES